MTKQSSCLHPDYKPSSQDIDLLASTALTCNKANKMCLSLQFVNSSIRRPVALFAADGSLEQQGRQQEETYQTKGADQMPRTTPRTSESGAVGDQISEALNDRNRTTKRHAEEVAGQGTQLAYQRICRYTADDIPSITHKSQSLNKPF